MALQVWLPLTGNLKNLGLDDITVTNNGATVSTEGKIGSCYSFDGTDDRIYSTNFSLGNVWSVALWVKDDASIARWNALIVLNNNNNDADVQMAVYTYPSQNRFEVCVNTTYNSNIPYTPGQWNHIAAAYDGTSCKCYLNGELKATISNSTLYSGANLTIGARCKNTAGAGTSFDLPFKGYLNDLRIYDDCLSPKEIKLLSQGLVAHYPLNDGIGGENLIQKTAVSTKNKAAIRMVTTTDIVTEDGFLCYQVTGVNTAGHFYGVGATLTANTTYTYSAWVKCNKTANFRFSSLGHFSVVNSASTASDKTHEDVVAQRIYKPSSIEANKWTKISITFTTNSLDGSTFGVYPKYNLDSTYTLFIREMKLEKGSVATPWIPNPNDELYSAMGFDDAIVYDCSGYGHHGSTVGTGITYSSETPRYTCSTDFQQSDANNSYINLGTGGKVSDEITVSEWVYMDSWTTDPHPFSCTEGGGWNIEKNSNKPTFPVNVNTVGYVHSIGGDISTPLWTDLLSGWHMFTGTYDGFNVKLYIDGELVANKSTGKTDKLPIHYHATNPILIHSEPTSTTGSNSYPACKMSDMRIYATALSAEDIKSLYETKASIDNYSNIYAYEFMEV